MTVQCYTCDFWSLTDAHPALGHLGLGRCKVKSLTKGHTFSGTYERECPDHKPAEKDKAAKRMYWLKAKGHLRIK